MIYKVLSIEDETELHFFIRYSVFHWLNHEFMLPMAMIVVECKLVLGYRVSSSR